MLSEKISAGLTDEDLRLLRSFVPLYTLSVEHFDELVDGITVEQAYRGQTLFSKGETNQENIYLLEGQLNLLEDDKTVEQISAGSNTARFPIAHELPRKFTARANSPLRYARMDSSRLSGILARQHTNDYEVDDLDEDAEDDWMSQLLQSPVMQQIPASNIQRVMMCVERVEVDAGTSIIRQGDPGDFYYMLNRGQAVVSRDNDDGTPPVELARLSPGSSFGEEALLSDAPRNSTITMLTAGTVVRLSKEDFIELIQHPMSTGYDLESATALVADGAVWLDVRPAELQHNQRLPSGLKVPFAALRYQADSLDTDRHYVIVANSRTLAASAAFLLTEQGYDVSFLNELYEIANSQLSLPAADPDQGLQYVLDESAQPELCVARAAAIDEPQVCLVQARGKEPDTTPNSTDAGLQQSTKRLEGIIDQAKSRIQRLEQDRLAIEEQSDRQNREMEALLIRVTDGEIERDGLRKELADAADREEALIKRLRKAESQGIEERDRAESASQQHEDVTRKLENSEQKRQLESDSFARSLGELKEQITELQLELEQSRCDLEEMRKQSKFVR